MFCGKISARKAANSLWSFVNFTSIEYPIIISILIMNEIKVNFNFNLLDKKVLIIFFFDVINIDKINKLRNSIDTKVRLLNKKKERKKGEDNKI